MHCTDHSSAIEPELIPIPGATVDGTPVIMRGVHLVTLLVTMRGVHLVTLLAIAWLLCVLDYAGCLRSILLHIFFTLI